MQNAVSSDLGATVSASKESGVEIVGFSPSSPLQAAGLHIGDIIRTVNGRSVKNPEEFHAAIAELTGGNFKIAYLYLESRMWLVQKSISIDVAK